MRLGLFLLLFCGVAPVPGQVPDSNAQPNDQDLYESFFAKVARLKEQSNNPHVVISGGRSATLIVPKLQDLIGLTDSEVQLLYSTALDLVEKLRVLMQRRPSVFEARLQRIESGHLSPSLAKEFEEMDQEHSRLIADHVQRLKDGVGDKEFKSLERFVHSPTWERDLTPTVDGRAVFPAKK
jgi:hypothetical protein